MDAIEEVTAGPDDQLMSLAALTGDPHRRGRAMLRGAAVTVRLSSRRFGGPGECFLLGSVLERFLAQWVSLNAFSRLTIQDTEGGAEPIGWPARLGRRQLI
jgi:type VI secretion system protein ImpG